MIFKTGVLKNIKSMENREYNFDRNEDERRQNTERLFDNKNKIVHPNTESPTINLPLTQFYLNNFIYCEELERTNKLIFEEKQKFTDQQILNLKIEINKRLNQINNDPEKVSMIATLLSSFHNHPVYIEIFTSKFLEQCVVQISRNLISYKQFSFLFAKLFNKNLFCFYKYKLITKKGDCVSLRGLYGCFFGIIIEMDMKDELVAFIGGILNADCNQNIFVIVEVLLIVCENYLHHKIPSYFVRLIRYIKINIVSQVEETGLKYRLEELISKWL